MIDDELKEIPLFLEKENELNPENLLFNLARLTEFFVDGDVKNVQRKAAYSIYWASKIVKERLNEKD